MHYMYHSVFIPYHHYIFIWASSCMICKYNSLLAILNILTSFKKFIDFKIFYDNYTSRSGVGGVRLSILYYVTIFLLLRLFLFSSQITVFMTLPGIITVGYDRTLPICLYDICVTDIFSLYWSLLFYSIDIYVVDYDIYHCLLHMIYVLWLAIYGKLCRGVLIVYMLSVTGRLATLK